MKAEDVTLQLTDSAPTLNNGLTKFLSKSVPSTENGYHSM